MTKEFRIFTIIGMQELTTKYLTECEQYSYNHDAYGYDYTEGDSNDPHRE